MPKDAAQLEVDPMSPEMMATVAERFRALSDPNRLRLLQLFVRRDRSVQELAEAAGLNLANTSKHLAILCKAGLIRRHKEGTRVIYTLDGPLPKKLCALVCDDVRSRSQRALRG